MWVSNGDMAALYSPADKRLLISQRYVSCHRMGGRKRLCISSDLPAKVKLVTPSPATWSPFPGLEEQLTGGPVLLVPGNCPCEVISVSAEPSLQTWCMSVIQITGQHAQPPKHMIS